MVNWTCKKLDIGHEKCVQWTCVKIRFDIQNTMFVIYYVYHSNIWFYELNIPPQTLIKVFKISIFLGQLGKLSYQCEIAAAKSKFWKPK